MDTQTLTPYLRDLLVDLFEGLLDHPKEAKLEFVSSAHTIFVSASTVQSDRGKLIGLRGRTADSIRTLLGAVCGRYQIKFHFEVLEEGEGKSQGSGKARTLP